MTLRRATFFYERLSYLTDCMAGVPLCLLQSFRHARANQTNSWVNRMMGVHFSIEQGWLMMGMGIVKTLRFAAGNGATTVALYW